jgi:hypothetical protein
VPKVKEPKESEVKHYKAKAKESTNGANKAPRTEGVTQDEGGAAEVLTGDEQTTETQSKEQESKRAQTGSQTQAEVQTGSKKADLLPESQTQITGGAQTKEAEVQESNVGGSNQPKTGKEPDVVWEWESDVGWTGFQAVLSSQLTKGFLGKEPHVVLQVSNV